MSPVYIDLDEVSSEVEFTLKLDGVEHVMVEPSVEDFIKNLRAIEKLSIGASMTEELELSITMITRAFPTITRERLEKMKFSQLRKINDYVLSAGGQKVEQEAKASEGETPEGNAPAAS